MILLRNFDFATKYFDYESKTEINETSNPKICGWYKFIDGLLSALLVIDNNLFFLYGEKFFLITNSHKILLEERDKVKKKLYLLDGNNELVRLLYSMPDSQLNVSPFEYIDMEDFKWGEFLEKIINDKERKKNFVANLMENH